MHHFLSKLIITISLLTSVTVLAAEEPIPPLVAIHAAYVDSMTSIRTIDYELRLDWKSNSSEKPSADMTKWIDLRVVRDGGKQLFFATSHPHEGDWTMQDATVFDGQRFLHSWAKFDAAGLPLEPPVAEISLERPATYQTYVTIDKLLGQALWGGSSNVSDLLGRVEGTLGWDVINNSRCVQIDLGEHARFDRFPKPDVKTTAWLDPLHGYLPRRIRSDMIAKPTKGEPDYREMEVFEFTKIADSDEPEKSHWIPASGISRNSRTSFHLTLQKAVVNSPIVASTFEPKYLDGTVVTDRLQYPPKKSYVGEVAHRSTQPSEAAANPLTVPTPAAVAVSARPGDQSRWTLKSVIMWLVVAVVMATAILTVRRFLGR